MAAHSSRSCPRTSRISMFEATSWSCPRGQVLSRSKARLPLLTERGTSTRHDVRQNPCGRAQARRKWESVTHPDRPHSFRLVALASFVGTTIEWYDFFLYGTAAALVFNHLFFPKMDPRMGTLAAFGTYAVGFIARPIGGIIIGHYGDR